MNLYNILAIGFSGMHTWQAVLYILCGLGIFLYGIGLMGNSLKVLAGARIKNVIEKFTDNPFKGLIVGLIVTMITQSSSGTSALAVSLVAAGLMTFKQSLGVLLGANIGGTILPLILALSSKLKIMPIIAVVLVFIGATIVFFSKKKKIQQIGLIVLGFGFIFFGNTIIDMSFKTIVEGTYKDKIETMFESISGVPILGVLVGLVFTLVEQSSSCTISIVQGIYSSGTIALKGGLAIMLGANIGTTITALIASLGSNKTAKKVAVANILFKFLGVLVFGVILWIPFKMIVTWFNDSVLGWEGKNNELIISFAHLGFNIVNSFVFLFLLTPITFLTNLIVRGDDESDLEKQLQDYALVKRSPGLAIEFVKKAIDYMGEITKEYFKLTYDYSFENISGAADKAAKFEYQINGLDTKIHEYLIKLTQADLSSTQTDTVSKYLDTIKDLERVGDHCTNIVEFFTQRYEAHLYLSEEGTIDLKKMFDKLEEMVVYSIDAISSWDKEKAKIVLSDEEVVDDMEEYCRKRHILRLNKGICSVSNLDYYVDIVSNLERIGDHTNNIAENVINDKYCEGEEYYH